MMVGSIRRGQRVDRVVDLGLEEVGHLAEHRVERAGLLADRRHLDDHAGKMFEFCIATVSAVPVETSFWICLVATM